MSTALLVAVGCLLHLASALAALPRRRPGAVVILLALAASACLGTAGVLALAGAPADELRLAWPVPGGAVAIAVDALSGAFLLPIAALGAVAAVYARGYWDGEASARRTRAAVGALLAGMALVVTARHGLWFLLCWEAMALAAWVALSAEHRRAEVRRAGWIYLVFTHLGTACLTAMVVLLGLRGGGYDWRPLGCCAAPLDDVIVVLALVGFGAKAGLVPLHAWLPGAHASAPSHVSALLSAVMLKTGIYGILRITGLLPEAQAWWGVALVILGAASAVYGIASALTQSDGKRLLACSSVENLGIIAMAVGLMLVARAAGAAELAALAGAAAILHFWHHSAFKGLLFCGAGAVLHATGTRRLDRLGGLLARMPRAGGLLLLGAAAAAGLPGFAGFASEWPLYCAGFTELRGGGWLGVAVVAALALGGGLAVAAYATFAGGALLGEPRSAEAARAHEPGPTMLAPMAALALACLLLPLAVPWTLPLAAAASGAGAVATVPGLAWVALGGTALLLLGAALWWRLHRALAAAPPPRAPTWDCGYAEPSARMQYTPGSFAAILGRDVAPEPIRPPATVEPARGLFPAAAAFATRAGDGILDRWFVPAAERCARLCLRLRLLQQGSLHAYIGYALIAVILLLAAAMVGVP